MNGRESDAPVSTHPLPPTAEAYLRMVNTGDAAGFGELFAADAVVDDNGRTIRGLEAVKAWGVSDIFQVKVRLELLGTAERDGATVLTTKVDGDFDRTGLPDPLVMENEVRTAGGKITALVCRLANA